ncbi:MAG: UvrB/UvrC motif-containing protein [Mycoplasmataceae bacterium]|nr:UvrB/UvrC motif-containing protein [Mycoplasmataceae bacterium]
MLSSGGSKLIRELTLQMNEASELQRYEIARDLKETIDVISFVEKNEYLSISMLFYRGGSLLSKKIWRLKLYLMQKKLLDNL